MKRSQRPIEITIRWTAGNNCKNVNLCKGEVEAKNINKAYTPERRMRRIVRNRSGAGRSLSRSLSVSRINYTSF